MQYTIRNDFLNVTVSDVGAELRSVKGNDGWEWLWQGDPKHWGRRAPILFPFCGRTWRGLSTVYGVPCEPGLHGFFQDGATVAEQIGEDTVTLVQTESAESLSRYPFPYEVKLCYTLNGETLTVRAEVTNMGTRTMPYGFGAHPGFRLPFAGELKDHYIRFPENDGLEAVNFDSTQGFPVDGSHPVILQDGERLILSDAEMSEKACFFCKMPPEATLMNDLSPRRVTIRYEGFPYLGIWKAPGADFVCMEPWCTLPAMHRENTELTERADFFQLKPGETGTHTFSICFWKAEN